MFDRKNCAGSFGLWVSGTDDLPFYRPFSDSIQAAWTAETANHITSQGKAREVREKISRETMI